MTTTTETLADFLLARIAEDEAVAEEALDRGFGGWEHFADLGVNYESRTHIARHDPARVLRACAAKEAVVRLHTGDNDAPCQSGNWVDGPCPTLRALASEYAGRPGWREEWAL